MDSIRWLQLSDLHIFINDPSWEDFQKYLQHYLSSCQKPDFIVITGDYRNIWANEQYDKAERFIRDLMHRLSLNLSKDLFLIPGNHDLRPQNKKAVFPGKLLWKKASETDDDPRTHELKKLLPSGLAPWDRTEYTANWLDKHTKDPKNYLDRLCGVQRCNAEDENIVDFQPLLNGFAEYCDLAKNLIPWYGESSVSPADVHCRYWRNDSGLGFNLVHLNTALTADGSRNHYHTIDLISSKKILNSIRNGLPTLILAHNSFYDLHPKIQSQLIGSLSAANTCAWLCGDAHRFDTDKTIPRPPADIREPIPILTCGKSAPDHQDDYSDIGFFDYEYDGENITAQFYKWSLLQTQKDREILIPLKAPEPSVGRLKSPKPRRLMIGYLSCNPVIDFEKKYHLGHAYFIYKMDQILENQDYAFIMTSSSLRSHNRTRETYRADMQYGSQMIEMWKRCFNGKVEVLDIKNHFEESDNWLDEPASKLLNYVTAMERIMERDGKCNDIADYWFHTENIEESDYNYIKDRFTVSHGSSTIQTELLSFVYLLHKRPIWYNSDWLIHFIDFWNRRIYFLIHDKLQIPVSPGDFCIVESRRNHYVWDAISYCAKRYSYGNFPRVEYFDSLLNIDCQQAMRSSDAQKAVFLADHNCGADYPENFRVHVKKLFGTDKEPNVIAEEYYHRLFKS